MRKRKKAGKTIFQLALAVFGISLLAAADTKPAGFFANMQNYNTEQGLALSSINCGFRDKAGNLWFGTDGGGVSRYDGKSFTTFTTAEGLALNSVYCITEDSKGKMWFGTYGGGVSRYDGKKFVSFTTSQGLSSNIILSILEDKNGNIWLGTLGGGVCRLTAEHFTVFGMAQGLGNNSVICILEDKDGMLWFGTQGGGVSRYNPGKGSGISGKSFINYTTAQGLADSVVFSMLEDKKGNLWFATQRGGVSCLEGQKFTNYTVADGLLNNKVHSIGEDNSGTIWFGTNGGLSRFSGGSFTSFTTAQGLSNNVVRSITKDKSGNLWLGTYGGGLTRYDGNSFITYTTAQGLVNNAVISIMEDKSGKLWFGTFWGGVSCFDAAAGGHFTNYTTAQGLAGDKVTCMKQDTKGNLWFGTFNGLSLFDDEAAGRRFTNFTTAQGLAGNKIFSMKEDRSGNLWLGTNGGLSCFDGKSFTNFPNPPEAGNNVVHCINEDDSGNLWFGTAGGGVLKFDGKSFHAYTKAQGLAGNVINCITKDKEGNLWFGTDGGGLSFLRLGAVEKIENYTSREGLANDVVYDIVEDKQGNIVIGTNAGFTLLKGGYVAGHKLGSGAEYYNTKTGYPVKDLCPSGMLCDSKGIIWAGSGGGKLVRFDYSAIHKNPDAPTVVIQNIKVNARNVCWERDSIAKNFPGISFDGIAKFYPVPQNLVLPYECNNLNFDFAAIEPARPYMVNYQYKLEGYDKNWSPVTKNSNAVFGNIFEGSYTFKLKAQSPDGVWSLPISYTFRVLPPWWRTWWMYMGYLAFGVSGIWIIFRWRTTALRQKFRMIEFEQKALRAQMNPHFIFNSLISIQNYIGGNDNARAEIFLTRFAKVMRNVLSGSGKAFVLLEEELKVLENYLELEKLRLRDRFDFVFRLQEGMDPSTIKIPSMLIQPYIENAIVHGLSPKSGKGRIDIGFSIGEAGRIIICEIEDNGIGRKKAGEIKEKKGLTHESMSMSLTRERLEVLNRQNKKAVSVQLSDLTNEANEAIGTKVVLNIPFNEVD